MTAAAASGRGLLGALWDDASSGPGEPGALPTGLNWKKSAASGASAGVMAGVARADSRPGVVVPVDDGGGRYDVGGANDIWVGADEREMLPADGVGVADNPFLGVEDAGVVEPARATSASTNPEKRLARRSLPSETARWAGSSRGRGQLKWPAQARAGAQRRTSLVLLEGSLNLVSELVEVDLGVKAPPLLHVDAERADLGVDRAPGRDDGLALDALLDELERAARGERRGSAGRVVEQVRLEHVLLRDEAEAGAEDDVPDGDDWVGGGAQRGRGGLSACAHGRRRGEMGAPPAVDSVMACCRSLSIRLRTSPLRPLTRPAGSSRSGTASPTTSRSSNSKRASRSFWSGACGAAAYGEGPFSSGRSGCCCVGVGLAESPFVNGGHGPDWWRANDEFDPTEKRDDGCPPPPRKPPKEP